MELLRCLEILESRPVESRRDVLDIKVTIHGQDAWAEAATAAVMLAGCLDDSVTDADLDDGLRHFLTCYEADIISDDQWRETMDEVISARMAELESLGAFADQ